MEGSAGRKCRKEVKEGSEGQLIRKEGRKTYNKEGRTVGSEVGK